MARVNNKKGSRETGENGWAQSLGMIMAAKAGCVLCSRNVSQPRESDICLVPRRCILMRWVSPFIRLHLVVRWPQAGHIFHLYNDQAIGSKAFLESNLYAALI